MATDGFFQILRVFEPSSSFIRRSVSPPRGASPALCSGMRRVLLFICLAAAVWWLWPSGGVRHPPGVTAPTVPAQQVIPPRDIREIKGFRLQAQATYAIHARV